MIPIILAKQVNHGTPFQGCQSYGVARSWWAAKVKERLRRLGLAYVDGVYSDGDYRRQKQALELDLESLVVPEVNAATQAGELVKKLGVLWIARDNAGDPSDDSP